MGAYTRACLHLSFSLSVCGYLLCLLPRDVKGGELIYSISRQTARFSARVVVSFLINIEVGVERRSLCPLLSWAKDKVWVAKICSRFSTRVTIIPVYNISSAATAEARPVWNV